MIKKKFSLKYDSKINLRKFNELKNKILILRKIGGLGDIFMHRMIFEDIKNLDPNIDLYFACPQKYHDAVNDYPGITVIDSTQVYFDQFGQYYDTTSACCEYENWKAPYSDLHRSDIWANHCGIELKNHNMHFNLNYTPNKKPIVLFSPISAMRTKNLLPSQIKFIVEKIRDMGLEIIGCHNNKIKEFEDLKVPIKTDLNIKQFISLINSVDYVISVDTSTFHCAGGLKKPLLGIFAWSDGKVYGKYYDCVICQKHRDNGNWDCGPCYLWCNCKKEPASIPKPCITELTLEEINNGIIELFKKFPIKQL